jgi:hypothetical protein
VPPESGGADARTHLHAEPGHAEKRRRDDARTPNRWGLEEKMRSVSRRGWDRKNGPPSVTHVASGPSGRYVLRRRSERSGPSRTPKSLTTIRCWRKRAGCAMRSGAGIATCCPNGTNDERLSLLVRLVKGTTRRTGHLSTRIRVDKGAAPSRKRTSAPGMESPGFCVAAAHRPTEFDPPFAEMRMFGAGAQHVAPLASSQARRIFNPARAFRGQSGYASTRCAPLLHALAFVS